MAKKFDLNLDRLAKAMKRSRQTLEFARTERLAAVRDYAGSHYADEGSPIDMPVNLLSAYIKIIMRSLVGSNPRVHLSVFDRQHKPAVRAMQDWGNREIKRMDLADTLGRIVLDGLFSLGIAKVALATPADALQTGWRLPAGMPFIERVDLDDWAHDPNARDLSECDWYAHRIRAPFDAVRNSPVYEKKIAADLKPTPHAEHNEEGDERVSQISRGYYSSDEDFSDYVDLWEVYVPSRREIYTLVADGEGGVPDGVTKPLRVQSWIGPDTGPYHFLGFLWVPGNAMPKGPIQDLVDLNRTFNRIWRKLMRQAERQKDLTITQDPEDCTRIVDEGDGGAIHVKKPDATKTVPVNPGPNQINIAFAAVIRDIFSWLAGNLDSMGGLSAQSKTATQDKLLAQNSSLTVADMQEKTTAFVSRVCEAQLWYWWNHPTATMDYSWAPRGLPEFERKWNLIPATAQAGPGDLVRSASFDSLDLRVDPYSLRHQSPEERGGMLDQVVMQIIAPMMTLLQQQGIYFDLGAYLDKRARLFDMPDLTEIVTVGEPVMRRTPGDGGGEGPGMPASTERRYVRENVSQRTREGNDQNLMNAMMGVDTGGSQQSAGSFGEM